MVNTAALTASLYTRDFHNLVRFVRKLRNCSADARQTLVLDIEAAIDSGIWHANDIDKCMHTLPVLGKLINHSGCTRLPQSSAECCCSDMHSKKSATLLQQMKRRLLQTATMTTASTSVSITPI
jgi:hypothetical protein